MASGGDSHFNTVLQTAERHIERAGICADGCSRLQAIGKHQTEDAEVHKERLQGRERGFLRRIQRLVVIKLPQRQQRL